MGDFNGWSERVPMPLWALVHSVRYAMGRRTYANSDAAELLHEYWNRVPEFMRQQFRDDFNGMEWGGALRTEDRAAWLFMFEEARDE